MTDKIYSKAETDELIRKAIADRDAKDFEAKTKKVLEEVRERLDAANGLKETMGEDIKTMNRSIETLNAKLENFLPREDVGEILSGLGVPTNLSDQQKIALPVILNAYIDRKEKREWYQDWWVRIGIIISGLYFLVYLLLSIGVLHK